MSPTSPERPPAAPEAEPAGLTRAEADRRLLIRYHRQGDQVARELLVERLLPLARRMARRYRRSDEPLDDLVQVATLGLIKAIDRFDPARETAFSSYAVPTMLGELKRYFRDNGWAVHVPRGMQERVMQVDNAVKDLSRRLGRSPSVAEIGEQIDLSQEQVLEAMEAASAYDAVSLESYRFGDQGDGETYAESRTSGSSSSSTAPRSRPRSRRCRRVIGSCSTCASSRTSRRPRSPSASASLRCTSRA
jgi:RNA polymerase sigma-B factor